MQNFASPGFRNRNRNNSKTSPPRAGRLQQLRESERGGGYEQCRAQGRLLVSGVGSKRTHPSPRDLASGVIRDPATSPGRQRALLLQDALMMPTSEEDFCAETARKYSRRDVSLPADANQSPRLSALAVDRSSLGQRRARGLSSGAGYRYDRDLLVSISGKGYGCVVRDVLLPETDF